MCGHCFTVCCVCFDVCCNPAFLAAKSNKAYYYYYYYYYPTMSFSDRGRNGDEERGMEGKYSPCSIEIQCRYSEGGCPSCRQPVLKTSTESRGKECCFHLHLLSDVSNKTTERYQYPACNKRITHTHTHTHTHTVTKLSTQQGAHTDHVIDSQAFFPILYAYQFLFFIWYNKAIYTDSGFDLSLLPAYTVDKSLMHRFTCLLKVKVHTNVHGKLWSPAADMQKNFFTICTNC